MNVALLCNSGSWGGLEINICKLALWLHQKGHKVLLLCPKNSKAEKEATQWGLAVKEVKTKFKYADVIGAMLLKNLLKGHESKALIIGHSKDIHLSVLANLLPGYHFKTIYLQQMEIGIDKKDFLHTFFYTRLDSWVAPLPSIKESTIARTKIQPEKVHVIPLCIEVEKFANVAATKQEARALFKLPEHVFLAGIIGRLDPGKGQHTVIEALKILKNKGVEVHALVMGDETMNDTRAYPQKLKQMVADYGLSQQVHFRPFTSETPLAFRSLDVFVMASIAETFGMVTVEAMASGVPVIGAKAGGTQYILRKNATGLFFKPEDAADLAEQLLKIKNNSNLVSGLAYHAHKYATENFSHNVMCEKIMELAGEKVRRPEPATV